MHIQQTKLESRATGGPQYYFHNVPEPVKEFLRKRGACRLVLQTPYGIASSSFMAVGRDHKLSAKGKVVPAALDTTAFRRQPVMSPLGRPSGSGTASRNSLISRGSTLRR